MSAAEELKALVETAGTTPWVVEWYENGGVESISLGENDFIQTDGTFYGPNPENAALIVALRNALPQIVAVVETSICRRFTTSPCLTRPEVDLADYCKSCAALAALDEVLP